MKRILLPLLSLTCLFPFSCDFLGEHGSNKLLTPPQPFVNPQNDDEYFFNYRLTNFAPGTEPLITETFGNAMRFEPEGFWEHPSYTSFVVGFTTNLPALSAVEYGETAKYGQRTGQSDAYYYQHLHYIRGLKPGITYHYRITVQCDQGNEITSGDHTFTLSEIPREAIRIPDDMTGPAPYTLTKGNALYVVTTDLTVPTLAINIKAHNVTVDLDGHTIVYDNDRPKVTGNGWDDYAYNEEASFGIRAGLWNFTNAKIFNGVVRQGRNGGAGFIGCGFNPIFLNHMGSNSHNEIAGVTVDYYGNSVAGMIAGNGYVHHNVIIDRGTVVDNRHQGIKALNLGSSTANEAAWNSIRRFRHQGLYSNGRIHHNELYADSFDTNSFMIGPGEGATVTRNKLFGMGYHPLGIGWANNITVRNNFIYLHGFAPTLRSTEYNRKSGIAGLRTTNYDDSFYNNMLYEENIIILKAEDGCTQARGIWSTNGFHDSKIIYRRNTVKVEAMPGNLKNTQNGFYNGDVNNAICAVTFSGAQLPHPKENPAVPDPIIFEDNHLIGNVNLVVIGEGYGITSSVRMYRTKLEKIGHDSDCFHPVRLGYWYWNTFNNRMIDTETKNITANEMTPDFYGNSGYMQIHYGYAHELTLTANSQPLRNTGVTISIDGVQHAVEKTDGNGKLRFDVLTVQHLKDAGKISQTDYRQYTFTVSGYTSRNIAVSQLKNTSAIAF